MEAADLLRRARLDAGLTQRELAERTATSQTAISAYEGGKKQPSVATLSRLLAGAGSRLSVEPAERPVVQPTRAELERRGRVLVDVLELAHALPSRHEAELPYPPLKAVLG